MSESSTKKEFPDRILVRKEIGEEGGKKRKMCVGVYVHVRDFKP